VYMPESKLGKMSGWFRQHFGSNKKSNSENTEKKTNNLVAKNKEEASKSSIKKTFKNAWGKIKQPIWKQILKSTTEEEYKKVLDKIDLQKFKSISAIKSSICYVKTLQFYGKSNSKIVMQGKPKNAAAELEGIVESNEFDETTQEKLLELSKRIKRINSLIWSGLIKIIDNSFDDKDGSNTLSKLVNTKDSISDQQSKTIIQQLSSGSISPSATPTSLPTVPPKKPTSPSMTPTKLSQTSTKKPVSPSQTPTTAKTMAKPVTPQNNVARRTPPKPPTPLDIANQAVKQWQENKKGFVEEAKRNMQEQIDKERKEKEEIMRRVKRNSKTTAKVSDQEIADLDNIISKEFSGKTKDEVPENLDDLLKDF